MRNFTTEDFSGAGQYLIRNDKAPGHYTDPGYMSTITKKVGWIVPSERFLVDCPEDGNIYTLTDMSDGMTSLGYFDKRQSSNNGIGPIDTSGWKWVRFDTLQVLCDYLNNPELCKNEYRFATQEEMVRIIMYQKSRWR
jgi:hypothetical protein